jgi:phage terminase small subunit
MRGSVANTGVVADGNQGGSMMGTVQSTEEDRKLTDRQERFAQEYSANGGVAATAAVAAGYSAASAASQGSRLLKNVNVAARIRELHEETAHRLGATRETVVSELAAIAFSNLGHVVTFGPAGIELRPIDEIPRADLAGIATLRHRVGPTSRSTSVKMMDKIRALGSLGRMLGLFDGNTQPMNPFRELDGLNEEQVVARAEALREARLAKTEE